MTPVTAVMVRVGPPGTAPACPHDPRALSDCHALFLADGGYNASRSNNPFRTCNPACTEKPTDLNNGQGGGSGVYPGNSNWRTGSGPTGMWETWIGRRGDVARALFYLDVRYEGGAHGGTGYAEPNLHHPGHERVRHLWRRAGLRTDGRFPRDLPPQALGRPDRHEL